MVDSQHKIKICCAYNYTAQSISIKLAIPSMAYEKLKQVNVC